MAKLPELLGDVFLANELGGNRDAAYRFIDCDGKNGRSGYAFGLCQWDISHNRAAADVLRLCGFFEGEIISLQAQSCTDLAPLNAKLRQSAATVDKCDLHECEMIFVVLGNICKLKSLRPADDLAMLALADYHNQYHMEAGGKMSNHLATLGRPFTHEDIFDFKLNHTRWGEKRGDDVKRRHGNLVRIAEEAGLKPAVAASI